MTAPPSPTVMLLAGSRPGSDPLAEAFGVSDKALVPLAGEPLLGRVARALLEHPAVGRVVLLAQEPERLLGSAPLQWLAREPRVSCQAGGSSVSASLIAAIELHPDDYPFLVTTADHGLLDRAMIDAFLEGARASRADLAFGVVERRVLTAAYPGNRRTWLRFRGGAYSGANLFYLAHPRAARALELWRGIEQQRKRGRAVIGAFGPLILAGVLLRLLSLRGALALAGRRLGLTAAAIELPMAEACIDIDKPSDHALATAILEARARQSATIAP